LNIKPLFIFSSRIRSIGNGNKIQRFLALANWQKDIDKQGLVEFRKRELFNMDSEFF